MMKQHGLNLKAGGAYYMPRLYDFLGRLRDNNNREWFKANKAEYDELRALWLADIDVMLAHMSEWWPSLRSVTAKGCAYRIYRDTRFSLDKTPLKTYFSAGTGLNGRSSHDPGFYLQLGPSRGSDGDESGLYGGLWCPDVEKGSQSHSRQYRGIRGNCPCPGGGEVFSRVVRADVENHTERLRPFPSAGAFFKDA